MDRMSAPTGIGLVLGAGGGAGGMWIRGVLDGLRETTGFRPEHASALIGTSIGAIAAARIGPHTPPNPTVVTALRDLIAPLPARPVVTPVLASVRRAGGRVVALIAKQGEADPLTWVEGIEPDTRACVNSMQRFPPKRRATRLTNSADPVSEIAASAAIPFGARRVVIDGRAHVDGAVWSVTNADLVSPTEAEVIIVIAPLVTTDRGTIVSMSGRHQLADELRPWRGTDKTVLVFAPTAAQYRRRQHRESHRADGKALALAAAGEKRSAG